MLRNLDGIDVAPIEIATPRPPATPPKGITVRRALAGAASRARLRLLIDDGSVNHSELETTFFQLLREEGLPLPERQQVVARGDGRFASADYGYPGTDGLVELVSSAR